MALSQTSYLGRSVLPHGETGVAVGIPAEVRRDVDLDCGDDVDLRYNREEGTLTVHFRD